GVAAALVSVVARWVFGWGGLWWIGGCFGFGPCCIILFSVSAVLLALCSCISSYCAGSNVLALTFLLALALLGDLLCYPCCLRYQVIWLLLGPQKLSLASKTAYESALKNCCDVVGECLCGAAQFWSSAACLCLPLPMAHRLDGMSSGEYFLSCWGVLCIEVDGIAVALFLVWSAAAAGLALQQMVCGLVSFASVGKGFAIGLADPSPGLLKPLGS
ncbi:hypothetical protein U1Q18_026814, partial [Sarracenia purpurea var. burkii]